MSCLPEKQTHRAQLPQFHQCNNFPAARWKSIRSQGCTLGRICLPSCEVPHSGRIILFFQREEPIITGSRNTQHHLTLTWITKIRCLHLSLSYCLLDCWRKARSNPEDVTAWWMNSAEFRSWTLSYLLAYKSQTCWQLSFYFFSFLYRKPFPVFRSRRNAAKAEGTRHVISPSPPTQSHPRGDLYHDKVDSATGPAWLKEWLQNGHGCTRRHMLAGTEQLQSVMNHVSAVSKGREVGSQSRGQLKSKLPHVTAWIAPNVDWSLKAETNPLITKH